MANIPSGQIPLSLLKIPKGALPTSAQTGGDVFVYFTDESGKKYYAGGYSPAQAQETIDALKSQGYATDIKAQRSLTGQTPGFGTRGIGTEDLSQGYEDITSRLNPTTAGQVNAGPLDQKTADYWAEVNTGRAPSAPGTAPQPPYITPIYPKTLASIVEPTAGSQQVSPEVEALWKQIQGTSKELFDKVAKEGVTDAKGNYIIQPGAFNAGQSVGNTPRDQQITDIQTQLTDLQAQQTALTKYGLDNTDSLVKDTTGNYVPKSTGAGDVMDWDKFSKDIIDLVDKKLAEHSQDITPFVWSDADTAMVKSEFDELYGPYYKSLQATAQKGAREAIGDLASTESLALKRQSRSLEEALSESRASMASRGLAFSGVREKGEVKQNEVSAEEMQRIRDVAGRGRRDTMSGLEATIGTEATQSLYPGFAVAPEYQNLGIQLQRGTPTTGIVGSLQSGQALAYQQELARRQSEARNKWLSDILMKENYSA